MHRDQLVDWNHMFFVGVFGELAVKTWKKGNIFFLKVSSKNLLL